VKRLEALVGALLVSWLSFRTVFLLLAFLAGCGAVDEPLPSVALSFQFDPGCEAPPVDAGLAIQLWRELGVDLVEVFDPPAERPADIAVCPTEGPPRAGLGGWTHYETNSASIQIDATMKVAPFGRVLVHEFGHAVMRGGEADHLPSGQAGIMGAVVAPIDEWSSADVEHLESFGFEVRR
jgi:hypothetical protein